MRGVLHKLPYNMTLQDALVRLYNHRKGRLRMLLEKLNAKETSNVA